MNTPLESGVPPPSTTPIFRPKPRENSEAIFKRNLARIHRNQRSHLRTNVGDALDFIMDHHDVPKRVSRPQVEREPPNIYSPSVHHNFTAASLNRREATYLSGEHRGFTNLRTMMQMRGKLPLTCFYSFFFSYAHLCLCLR